MKMTNSSRNGNDEDSHGKGRPKAIVLLSGGLDSSTAAAVALREGYDLIGLSISYGQRHSKEIASAKAVGKALGLKDHIICELGLGGKGSALLDVTEPLPQDRDIGSEIKAGGIPATYVPARNLMFLSIAAHWAEVLGADAVYTGFNAVDFSGYPDCSKEFVDSFQKTVSIGTRTGVEGRPLKIEAPLIDLTKADIIRLGSSLGVPFDLTWSCYEGGGMACGRCDSCILRMKGFGEAGIKDPLTYADGAR